MIRTFTLLFFISFCYTNNLFAQAMVTNGTTLTETGGRPTACNVNGFKTLNSASETGSCIQFTSSGFQSGAVWACDQIDLNQSFRISFDSNFGSDVGGGDGIAFVLQTEGLPQVIGGRGGGLGYAQGDGVNCLSLPCPIDASLAVEMDTWDNRPSGHNDLACDHMSIQTDGVMAASNTLAGPVCLTATASDVTDGAGHPTCVSWDPALNEMEVSFNGVVIATYSGDIRTIFPSSNVWWGFTAGSGGAAQVHSVCNVVMTTGLATPGCAMLLPVKLTDFTADCEKGRTTIDWTAATETDIESYHLQQSADGIHFEDISVVAAINSGEEQKYTYQHFQEVGKAYYRLEMIDVNGNKNYSKVINTVCSSPFDKNETAYLFPNPASNELNIVSAEYAIATIEMIDFSGKVVYRAQGKTTTHKINVTNLNAGIYSVFVTNAIGQGKWLRFRKP